MVNDLYELSMTEVHNKTSNYSADDIFLLSLVIAFLVSDKCSRSL